VVLHWWIRHVCFTLAVIITWMVLHWLCNVVSWILSSWQGISDRLLLAHFIHRHGHITVVLAYAPTDDSTDVTKDMFYDQLEKTLILVPVHDQLIVLVVLNATTGVDRSGFETVVGSFSSGSINDNPVRLLSLCLSFGLTVCSSWFKRRRIHRWNWRSNDIRRSKKSITSLFVREIGRW